MDARLMPLARAIYEGRHREAWGNLERSKWPRDERVYLKLSLDTGRIAEVELAIASAREVLKFFTVEPR